MKSEQLKLLRSRIEKEMSEIREALHKWSGHDDTQQTEPEGDRPDFSGLSYRAWKGRMDQRLFELSRALGRMDDEGYGYCEDCGEQIAWKRLEAVPATEFCINCMRRREDASENHPTQG